MPRINLKFWKLNSHQRDDTSSNSEAIEATSRNRSQHGLILISPDARAQAPVCDSGASVEPEAIFTVDIVAVHGLNGDAYGTWTHKNGNLWLRDFLPNQVPGARVFSFGYDSTVAFSRSFGDISDFARGLLSSLRGERQTEQEKSRKIIFLCHNIGGIVVKKALIIANEDRNRYRDILDSTRGILFFGTPHGGSDSVNFPKILANVANVALVGAQSFSPVGRFRSELLKALKKNSTILEEISASFTPRTVNLRIVTFYEQLLTAPLGIRVVERKSAIIGVANEDLIPLNADHRGICRFESEKSLLYKPVWQKIKEIAGEREEGYEQHINPWPVLRDTEPCCQVLHDQVRHDPAPRDLVLREPVPPDSVFSGEQRECLRCLYPSDPPELTLSELQSYRAPTGPYKTQRV